MSTTTEQSKAVALQFYTGLQQLFRGERPDLLGLITDDFVWRLPETAPIMIFTDVE